MKSLHIAVFSLFADGHVYPLLPVCKELARRGHRVTFVSTERYSEMVDANGAQPVSVRVNPLAPEWQHRLQAMFRLPCTDPGWWRTTAEFQLLACRASNGILDQVLPFYQASAPDLVLCDRYTFAGRIVAKRLGARPIQVSPHFAYYRDLLFRDGDAHVDPQPMLDVSNEIDEFLWQQGLRTTRNLWHTEQVNLHLIPPGFQFHRESFDSRFFFASTVLNRSRFPDREPSRDDRPLVLISDMAGRQGVEMPPESYVQAFVEGLASSRFRCVVSVRPSVRENWHRPLPENVVLNSGTPHVEILSKANLLVCHGGLGSCLEAVYSGVPVITVPVSPTTGEVAYRIEELGAGRRIVGNVPTPSEACAAVDSAISDTTMLERIYALRDAFRKSPGAADLANRIEQAR